MPLMSMSDFCQEVQRVMSTLPKEFHPYLDNVVVEVENYPDREKLLSAGFTEEEIDEGESLLGLFEPLELTSMFGSDAVDTESMLHRLTIFKGPLEEEFPSLQQLKIEIRKTVIHELAHHFGFTDRDLEKFDNTPNPFQD